jgi:hypothetical protein
VKIEHRHSISHSRFFSSRSLKFSSLLSSIFQHYQYNITHAIFEMALEEKEHHKLLSFSGWCRNHMRHTKEAFLLFSNKSVALEISIKICMQKPVFYQ